MIFAIILLVLLLISLFGNFAQVVARLMPPAAAVSRLTWRATSARSWMNACCKDNDSRNKIAVIEVDGIITSHSADPAGNNMVDVIKAQLDRAKEDSRVKAVILKVDSPGGEVMASDQINQAIADFQDEFQQAGDLLDGQPGGVGRLLHFRAVPLD